MDPCVTIIVLLPGTYLRLDSLRTGETRLESRRLDGALIGASYRDDVP